MKKLYTIIVALIFATAINADPRMDSTGLCHFPFDATNAGNEIKVGNCDVYTKNLNGIVNAKAVYYKDWCLGELLVGEIYTGFEIIGPDGTSNSLAGYTPQILNSTCTITSEGTTYTTNEFSIIGELYREQVPGTGLNSRFCQRFRWVMQCYNGVVQ